MNKKFKISFCTTCMGRLEQIKKTLPKNITDNLSYGLVEFVLLDYNSNDNLDAWVKNEMIEYINSGVLVYLKTFEPAHWNVSHAKNTAAKYGSGDIICNIDADQFLNKGFANYINDCFNENSNIFLTGRKKGFESLDTKGRVCLWKADFLELRGFDEKVLGYGFDDDDFYSRLTTLGREEKYIDDQFLESISHNDFERIKNTSLINDIDFFLVHRSKAKSTAFIMKKNGTFQYISTILIYVSKDAKDFTRVIEDEQTLNGSWKYIEDKIELQIFNSGIINTEISKFEDTYIYTGITYHKVKDEDKTGVCYYFIQLLNQALYLKNKEKKIIKVNFGGYGQGLIYKNFTHIKSDSLSHSCKS